MAPTTHAGQEHDALARRRLLLTVMCVGMFLVQLDVTIVNVALPEIALRLSTGVEGQQWVVDGYAVVLASLLLVLAGLLVHDHPHPVRSGSNAIGSSTGPVSPLTGRTTGSPE